MTARHFTRSFTTPCQLVTPTRSLLITSIHRSRVPPGLLLFPCGLHLRSCFWGRWSGIRCTWPSHCSNLCLSCSSTGNSPISFRMPTFRCMSHRVSPRMSLRHLIWKVFSLLRSCCVTGQVSAPHRRTDVTNSHLGGLAEVTAPEDFPPPHLVHFASLLEPHCYFFLYTLAL